MAQVKKRTTVVRIAVARLLSMCSTPTLASRAVPAAKTAERIAQKIQLIVHRRQFAETTWLWLRGRSFPTRHARYRRESGRAYGPFSSPDRRTHLPSCRWRTQLRGLPQSSYAG